MDNIYRVFIRNISNCRYMEIAIFLLFIVTINIVEGFTDYYIQRSSNGSIYTIKLWHKYDAIYKVLLFGAIAILLSQTIIDAMLYVLMFLTARWVVFEITLNLLNGNKWYYIGSVGAIDSFFQRLSYPKTIMILVKIILIIVLIILRFM